MSRITTITAALLAVAALAPAAGIAAHNAVRGAPQMYRVDDRTVQVRFVTDRPVRAREVKVAVSDAGATRKVSADGRHGSDHRYVARVRVDRALRVARKYTVRLTIGDDAAAVRKVVLRSSR